MAIPMNLRLGEIGQERKLAFLVSASAVQGDDHGPPADGFGRFYQDARNFVLSIGVKTETDFHESVFLRGRGRLGLGLQCLTPSDYSESLSPAELRDRWTPSA